MRWGHCSPDRRSTRRWRAPRPRSGPSSRRSSGSPSCASRPRSCGGSSAAGSRSTCSTTCAVRSSPPSSGSTASGRTRCAPARWCPARSPTSTSCRASCRSCRSRWATACSSSCRSPPCCGCRRCSRWWRSSCCRSRCGSRMRSRRALFPATWSAQQKAADIAQQVEETVTGVRVVKGFGQEAREVATLEAGARRLYGERLRAARMTARLNPALAALPTLGQVLVIGVGGWLALNGSITLGTFLAFTTYVAGLVGPARMLGVLVVAAQLARAGVERVYDLVDSQPDVVDPEHPRHPAGGSAGRGARRRHVRLHAPRAGARRGQPHRGAGGDARAGRAAGFGQVHGRAAPAALLRPAGGRAAPRRGAAAVAAAGRPAQRAGRGVRGGVPVLRHHPGQHRLRPPRRLGGRGAGRREGRAGARVRREPPRRLRHARRRARAHALRRAAAAGRAGQGGAHRPAGAGARRRHVRGRHRHRSRHPRHAARAHEGPHHPARRPPALLAGAGRPDRRARRGTGGRRRHGGRARSPGARCSASCSRSAAAADREVVPAGGVTPELWPAQGPPPSARIGRRPRRDGRPGPVERRAPATPELLAAVEALPPPPRRAPAARRPDHTRSRLPVGPAAPPGARGWSPWRWCSSPSMR